MADGVQTGSTDMLTLTSDIVASYVSNNSVPRNDLADLISSVHGALSATANGKGLLQEPEPLKPIVPINKTVKHDFIISLEDGRQYRSLKRHLTSRGITPAQYREKWGLRPDYPMVAPGYSQKRSELAKAAGLGQKAAGRRRKRSAKAA